MDNQIPQTSLVEQRARAIKHELEDVERVRQRILVANQPRHSHDQQPILSTPVQDKLTLLDARAAALQVELKELTIDA